MHNIYYYFNGKNMQHHGDLHDEFSKVMNFPDFYGRNSSALIEMVSKFYTFNRIFCKNGKLFEDNPESNLVLVIHSAEYFNVEYFDLLHFIGKRFSCHKDGCGVHISTYPEESYREYRGFHVVFLYDKEQKFKKNFPSLLRNIK